MLLCFALLVADARAADSKPKYSGKHIDFTAKDLDIRKFLLAIAEISKRNVVADEGVHGTLSIRLRNVPWDEALDIVLQMKGLVRQDIGSIIRVTTLATLKKEDAEEARQCNDCNTWGGPLKVRLIPVNCAPADVLASKVKELLSERGTVTVDARTNVLIVKDHPDVLAKAEQLVRDLDLPTPQVLIEARIVEVSRAYGPKLGIQWGRGRAGELVFPSLLGIPGPGDVPGDVHPNFVVNMPTPVTTSNGGFVFGTAGNATSVNRRLATGELLGSVKTVSAPKAVTLDNSPASITQGVRVPYAYYAGCCSAFIEPRLAFTVTPHVTADGSVILKVVVVHNDRPPQSTALEAPAVVHREASFDLLVKDGDTVAFGGIASREMAPIERHPQVTALVASDGSDLGTELLVVLSPRIIQRQASVVSSVGP